MSAPLSDEIKALVMAEGRALGEAITWRLRHEELVSWARDADAYLEAQKDREAAALRERLSALVEAVPPVGGGAGVHSADPTQVTPEMMRDAGRGATAGGGAK